MPFEERQHFVAHRVRCSGIRQAWMNAKRHASGTYGVLPELAVIQFGSQCGDVCDHGAKSVHVGRKARKAIRLAEGGPGRQVTKSKIRWPAMSKTFGLPSGFLMMGWMIKRISGS